MAEFLAWLEEPELVTAFHSSFASLPLAEVLELHWLALLQLLQLEGYCSEERFVHMCVELCGRYLDSMCKAGGGGGVGGFPDSAMDFALESIAGVLSVACATRAYRGAKTSVFAAAVAGAGLGAAPAVRGGDKAKKKRSTTTTTSTPVKDKDGQAVPAATAAATSSSSSSSSSSSPSTAPATTSVVLRCSVANICAAPLLRVRKTLRASVRAIRERRDELGERRGADGAASAAVAAADNNGGGGGGYDDDDESVERERALLARDQELACVVAACLWENASVGAALVPLKSATEWLAGTEAAAGGDAVSDWSSLYLGLVFVRCALLNAERLLLKVSTPCPLHIPLHALCASYTLPSPHPLHTLPLSAHCPDGHDGSVRPRATSRRRCECERDQDQGWCQHRFHFQYHCQWQWQSIQTATCAPSGVGGDVGRATPRVLAAGASLRPSEGSCHCRAGCMPRVCR